MSEGRGTLTGVTALSTDGSGYCALLTSGGVDCWGYDGGGDLGDGMFYATTLGGSATPVPVVGIGGSGTLTGVTALSSGDDDDGGYCAVLSSGGVDCWGYGYFGELGDGTFYTTTHESSATPVPVVGVGGSGTLTGVTALSTDGSGYCALLTSGGVDCWGYGGGGDLGDGMFYATTLGGSATPVPVVGVGGSGTLSGVTAVQQ